MFNNSVNLLTQEEMIKIYIDEFNISKERELMLKGEKYYKVENDILERKMIRYEDENPVEDKTKPNNRLAHGFMKNLVDDKVNYLLTKSYTMKCKNEEYLTKIKALLGKRFEKMLSKLGIETSNKGISWLHVYINSNGEFKLMKVPSEQVIPLWIDNDHEELQALIRYYDVETYTGKKREIITKVEYWTNESATYYVLEDGKLILDSEMYLEDENFNGHFKINNENGGWSKVPFIPFKNNDFELPDVQFIKTLIDNYDSTRSDISNQLEEIKNIIYALKGYGGENLSEFVRDLAYYRAIKLEDDSEVDTIESTINIDAAKAHYEALKKDIFDFGQGVDKNSDKLGNSPSGIALKFIYSGLDLKCNALEEWFKWSFQELIYFVNKYLEITKESYSDEEVEIIFNRDIAINESQAIADAQNSKGIISNKTIVANHPWVTNLDEELKQIEKENSTPEEDMLPNQVGGEDE
ncbi:MULTISPECIES: phage portal protein [Clostridium]|uniref:phage portal protein n=1 Tax=Clostridium TaxID=1485 RepID=UPI0011579E16|nr:MULTISPECIES: phage portal protein [Clostridium]MDY4605406.1 phage portal protein [Clostridium tertium]